LTLQKSIPQQLKPDQGSLIFRDGLLNGGEDKFLIRVHLGGEVPELGATEELPVEVLAPVAVRTVPLQEVFLTGFGLVVGMEVLFSL